MNTAHFRRQFNNDRTNLANIQSVAASPVNIPGRIPINSSGEVTGDPIRFPVKFTSQPYFSYGFEMQEGEGVIPGRLPTGSAVVKSWITQERLPGTVFYVGAIIMVVTTGLQYQKMILNFNFNGVALSNPG